MSRIRLRIGVVIATAVTIGGAFIAPQSAYAAPVLCTPGEKWYEISSSSVSYQLTHASGYLLGPGASYSHSKTASFVKQLSSSASVTAGAKISASGVVAAAEASVDVNLAAAGEETTTSSDTVEVQIASATKDRYYAAFSARKYYTGTYKYQQCGSDALTIKNLGTGTWHSYAMATVSSESALCTIGTTKRTSVYSASSAAGKACKATWW